MRVLTITPIVEKNDIPSPTPTQDIIVQSDVATTSTTNSVRSVACCNVLSMMQNRSMGSFSTTYNYVPTLETLKGYSHVPIFVLHEMYSYLIGKCMGQGSLSNVSTHNMVQCAEPSTVPSTIQYDNAPPTTIQYDNAPPTTIQYDVIYSTDPYVNHNILQ